MVFLHRMRRGRTVIVPSTFEYIKEQGIDGFRRIPKWGKTVEYEPLGPEFTDGMRLRGRNWRGSKDITDGKLQSILMTHPNYGLDFIAMDEEGGEAELIDSFFTANKANDTVYCWVTDRTFINAQGAAGHKTSKEFTEAVETYLNSVRRSFN